MNTKQAIKNLNAMKMNYDQRDKKSIPIQTIDMAIEALEKRIPQKTMYGHSTYADWRECRVCGSQVTRNATVKDKYCRNCGQATDWEELK